MGAISEVERKVLAYAQLVPDLAAAEIADAVGVKERSVRHALHSLLGRGVLTYHPFIDFYKLGFTEYGIFISLNTSGYSAKAKILETICQSRNVHWVAQLGGEYHLIVAVMARHISLVGQFIDDLRETYGSMIASKMISVRSTVDLFNRKFLYPMSYTVESLSFGRSTEIVEIDDTDVAILSSFGHLQSQSANDICRSLGLAPSTLKYRTDSLKQKGVLLGSFYWLDPFKLGFEAYRLLIYSKGEKRGFEKRLYDYCRKNAHIVNLITCIGAWDFEVGAEVANQQALMELTQQMTVEFPKEIEKITIFPIFSFNKVTTFPFGITVLKKLQGKIG